MLALPSQHAGLLERIPGGADDVPSPWAYDFCEIARRRRQNARRLAGLLAPLADEVTLLREPPAAGEVPQTLPVLVRRQYRGICSIPL